MENVLKEVQIGSWEVNHWTVIQARNDGCRRGRVGVIPREIQQVELVGPQEPGRVCEDGGALERDDLRFLSHAFLRRENMGSAAPVAGSS